MKKSLLLLACGFMAFTSVHAQKSTKKAPAAKTAMEQKAVPVAPVKMAKWPQLRAFHEVMSQTFHPAEEGKLEPIRERNGEMVARMRDLIGNPFPEPYRTSEMKVLVAQLEEKVMGVNKLVQAKASDKELMAGLSAAHDAFHHIVGLCRKSSGEAHHD